MPQFLLEPSERYNAYNKRMPRILYTKGEYRPEVKLTGWEINLESNPKDNDPYECGNINYFRSHYNRLGTDPTQNYETTTLSALNQIFDKKLHHKTVSPSKMVNLCSYGDKCETPTPDTFCPSPICVEYSTTMQSSYEVPYPYKMQRFGLPKKPYLLYNKLKSETPLMSPHKFFDEGFLNVTKEMQKFKQAQWHRCNPILGCNNDETPLSQKKHKCFELEYSKHTK